MQHGDTNVANEVHDTEAGIYDQRERVVALKDKLQTIESSEGKLLPAKKGQRPPDLRYFQAK